MKHAPVEEPDIAINGGDSSPGALPALWTVGHSTRTWDDFVALLRHHRIEAIADVRRFPGSRRHPWFASEAMGEALPRTGIAYLWLPGLGGRRPVQPGSPNGAWRNAAFQGYADHMASAEFAHALERALALVQTSSLPIGQVAEACGYASASRFSARFRTRFGCTPRSLRAAR